MTEKRQKQITLLAIILGLLTLSFIVVASSGIVFVMLVTPTPERSIITVRTTPIIIEVKTVEKRGPGTPHPTPDLTRVANGRIGWATHKANRSIAMFPTAEPPYITTMKRLGGMDGWGKTLGVILVLMLISSLMLFTRLRKQED